MEGKLGFTCNIEDSVGEIYGITEQKAGGRHEL